MTAFMESCVDVSIGIFDRYTETYALTSTEVVLKVYGDPIAGLIEYGAKLLATQSNTLAERAYPFIGELWDEDKNLMV